MDERYPIGRFEMPATITAEQRGYFINAIQAHPVALRRALEGLSESDLEQRYREGGWTIRQVVHHLADSHVNSYVRFKLTLTEDEPRIKTYEEARWAELPDARLPVDVSLQLLDALHGRWVALLRGMTDSEFARAMSHPEWGLVSLDQVLALYAWHCEHHVAHIDHARERAVAATGC